MVGDDLAHFYLFWHLISESTDHVTRGLPIHPRPRHFTETIFEIGRCDHLAADDQTDIAGDKRDCRC